MTETIYYTGRAPWSDATPEQILDDMRELLASKPNPEPDYYLVACVNVMRNEKDRAAFEAHCSKLGRSADEVFRMLGVDPEHVRRGVALLCPLVNPLPEGT